MTRTMGLMAMGAGADIWLSHDVEGIGYEDARYLVQVRSNLDEMSSDSISATTLVFATGAHS